METPKIGSIWVSIEAAGYIPAGIRVQISSRTQPYSDKIWYTYLDGCASRRAGEIKNNSLKGFYSNFKLLQKGPKLSKHWKKR